MEANLIKIPEIKSVLIEDFGIIKKANIKFSPGRKMKKKSNQKIQINELERIRKN